MGTNTIDNIYSDFRTNYQDKPDFSIDFYTRHAIFFNNVQTFKNKEELRLFIELTWQYLNALFKKDRYSDTLNTADKFQPLIDTEIDRLNATDLKDEWYNGILFLKAKSCYELQ